MSNDARTQLPAELARSLAAMRRRVRQILWRRGLAATLAVALATTLGAMALDAVWPVLPEVLRFLLTLAILGATAWTAWRHWIRPLRDPLSPERLARAVDDRHPEFEERFSSAVELTSAARDDTSSYSAEMVGEVARSAASSASGLAPRREFTYRTARPWLLTTVGAAAVFAALFALAPGAALRLLLRVWAPFVDVGNLYAGRIKVAPGSTRIPAGDPITIAVALPDPEMKPVYLVSGEKRLRNRERMTLVAATNGVEYYELTIPAVPRTLRYQVRAGYAISDAFLLAAEPRPAVRGLAVRLEYPAYTERAPVVLTNLEEGVVALRGTRAVISATASKPLASAHLALGDQALPSQPAPTGAAPAIAWNLALATNLPDAWELVLKDPYGFENLPEVYGLTVFPDLPPDAAIVEPATPTIRVRPDDIIPLAIEAHDDLKLGRVEMVVRADDVRAEHRDIPVPAPLADRPGTWRIDAPLDLGALKLENRGRLRVSFRVFDRVSAEFNGPQRGETQVLTLEIARDAEPFMRQMARRHEQAVRERLDSAKQEVGKAANEARQAREQLAAEKPDTPKGLQHAEEAREAAAKAEAKLQELAEALEHSLFKDMQSPVEQAAEESIAPARETAEDLPLAESAEQPQMAKDMEAQLQAAKEALQALEKQFADLKETVAAMNQLRELSAREEQLADNARATTPDANAAVQQPWQQEQQQAANDVNRLAEQLTGEKGLLARAQEAIETARAMESGAPENAPSEQGTPEGAPESAPEASASAQPPAAGQTPSKPEAGQPEGGKPESGQPEGGQPEAGQPEAGQPEAAGQPEGQMAESGQAESGQPESGSAEAGTPEAAAGASEAAPSPAEAAAEAAAAMGEAKQESAAAAQAPQAGPAASAADEAADALDAAADAIAKMFRLPGREMAIPPSDEAAAAQQGRGGLDPSLLGALAFGKPIPGADGEPASGQPQPGQNQPPAQTKPGIDPAKMATYMETTGLIEGMIPIQGITAIEWARIRGLVKSQAGQATEARVPPEYRTLVGRYFEEVSKEGRKK